MTKTPKTPNASLPAFLATISQESAVGKTTLMTLIADVLTLEKSPYAGFQADDKPRLAAMLGARVTDLKVDADLLIEQPSLLRTTYSPLYTACSDAKKTGTTVLLDAGAREVENIANFFSDVDLDEDLVRWNLTTKFFVPVQADPESIAGAAMTWERMQKVVPHAQLILVENLHDRGQIDRLKAQSPARMMYDKILAPLVVNAPRIIMPALVVDFWQPFEESGTRFLKVMALEAEDGASQFSMSVGDFKIARGNVTKFFGAMHPQIKAVLMHSSDGAGNAR
ncbi:hypothetical protein U0C82_18330 [Fulvimarina sp. 2208YS6-2-32]|uniref:AAA domain-containing protein n=1 Tax=Fulvimarina uroteuthidis TaxID=3098149 RepID=A0ABU5I859_9HYPH|nr:hypothetical protein [Fulvimarina sp. 2208YS6-2-32]MDY8111084.1 hypothetical protein [Fulvimarina sp. 2208YS6-2-32]